MRIAIVQGTRPEIVKNYSLVRALSAAKVPFEVFHTGQHSARRMCGDIYDEMGYRPDRRLTSPYRLGAAINWLQVTFKKDRVSHVVVNGDTAAALAGAIAALYCDIPVSHVEAGLRARDRFMIEERNRIAVDAIASLLFAYTEHESRLLSQSPDLRGRVFVEGNTTIDVLHDFKERIEGVAREQSPYVFVTMHRKEFTDSSERIRTVFSTLAEIARRTCRVVFPMHPRTRDAMRRHRIPLRLLGDVCVQPPCPVLESLALQSQAAAVITDSGCVQEEAYMLGVPCITIRENTERHLTVFYRANVVTGFDTARISEAVEEALVKDHVRWPEIYGRPGVGDRIIDQIVKSTPRRGISEVEREVSRISANVTEFSLVARAAT